jgi:hypothetical protein
MRTAGEEFVFNTPSSLTNYRLFKNRFMLAFGFNIINDSNDESNFKSSQVSAQLHLMQPLTPSNKFGDLSQINMSNELTKQTKYFDSDEFISPETGMMISGEWVSDLLERAAATNENLENSFHEIEFNGICVNGSKVVGTVLGNSNAVNVESSKVDDVPDGWNTKEKFIFNSNKCSQVTLDAISMRVPLKRQMIKELIELLFEQMKVIAPINPLSKGFILGVEGLFDRFPSLEIYHKLENSSASASPAETPRSYFIKKIREKYAVYRRVDPIISNLKKVKQQREKFTPKKQNVKRLVQAANTPKSN